MAGDALGWCLKERRGGQSGCTVATGKRRGRLFRCRAVFGSVRGRREKGGLAVVAQTDFGYRTDALGETGSNKVSNSLMFREDV